MSYPQFFDIARGLVQQGKVVRQFGTNPAVGTTYVPVTRAGVYQTPQPAGAVQLRIRAGGDPADSAVGTGAREITIEGIGPDGLPVSEAIATAGASASSLTAQSFIRVTRAYVSQSGSYGSQTVFSHAGSILIEDGAGNLWCRIHDTTIPRGQTEIAVYTVPRYQRFYLAELTIETDPANKINVVLFERRNILESAPPYSAMRMLFEFPSISGYNSVSLNPPIVVPELTDIGFLATIGSGTAAVSCSLNGVELRV